MAISNLSHSLAVETVRKLDPRDLGSLVALSGAAGWNQTPEDWARLLKLEPDGCFGLLVDGKLVATSTLVRYGRELAWLGMVLTHADYRGRGYGGRLTRTAMEHAWDNGVSVLKLDATDLGRPLYTRMGFRDEGPIERWATPPEAADTLRAPPAGKLAPYSPDPALDLAAFGADRQRLLDCLAGLQAATIPGQGFIMARAGVHAVQLGPCVARDAGTARALVAGMLAPGAVFYWDLLRANGPAAGLAASLGFRPARKLMRMSVLKQGVDVPHDDGMIWATAGFEYG